MSDFGAVMDQLITECRDAVATIPAGALGAERGVRSGEELGLDALPHVFVHSPAEAVELLEFQQEQRTFTCVIDLWTDGKTQEELAVYLDAIRDQIAANRSLSGSVDYATVTGREIFEFAEKSRKVGRLVVTTLEVV